MSTPSTIPAPLREAKTTALGIFNRIGQFSAFASMGVAAQMPASEGFLKLAAASIPGRMRRKTPAAGTVIGATAPETGLVVAGLEVAGATFDKIIAIDNDLLERTDAITSGEISRLIRQEAGIVGGEIDMQLSETLEANGPWVGGSSMFTSTNTILGTPQTFDNQEGTAGATAANLKTNYYKWLTFWGTLRGSHRYAVNAAGNRPQPVVVYPAAYAQGVDEAFEMPAPGAAVGTNTLAGKVRPMLNPYAADAQDHWFVDTTKESKLLAFGIVRAPRVDIWQDYENDCWKLKVSFGAAFTGWDATVAFMCT